MENKPDLDDAAEKPPSQEEREVLEALEARIRRKLDKQTNASDGEAS